MNLFVWEDSTMAWDRLFSMLEKALVTLELPKRLTQTREVQ